MPDNRLRQPIAELLASLPHAWREVLDEPAVAAELTRVTRCVEAAIAAGVTVYPADPFKALRTLSPERTRVVILGQDPYHGPGQAQGLAFSVPDTAKRPPSLRNMFKELAREYPDHPPITGNDLQSWADQGVLLLNTSLTVE
ncbi:MAG: uracil-DNA glycosylase family protein, partial [Burkholderiaceae bacterium]